jgi:hypothetical protein
MLQIQVKDFNVFIFASLGPVLSTLPLCLMSIFVVLPLHGLFSTSWSEASSGDGFGREFGEEGFK